MITTPEQMREAAIKACDDSIDDRVDREFVIKAIRAIPIVALPASTLESVYDNMADIPGLPEAYQPKNISAALRVLRQTTQPVTVTVKPLVWEDLGNGRAYRAACPLFGSIRIESYYSGEFHVLWSVPGFCDSFTPGLYETAELAKAAAQADYEARILSALTIHPADLLSDPRVVALVEAANDAKIILAEYEPHPLPILGRLLTALRAIGGEA